MFKPQGGLIFLGGMLKSILWTFAPCKLLISATYLCARPRPVYPTHEPARQKLLVFPELDKNFWLPSPICTVVYCALRSLLWLLFADPLTSDTSPLLQRTDGKPLSYSCFVSTAKNPTWRGYQRAFFSARRSQVGVLARFTW